MSQSRVISYAGRVCRGSTTGRKVSNQRAEEVHQACRQDSAPHFWIYMLIYSPQQNETKADIAVSGSSIRLQAGHFTFLSWQVACLLASRLLACLPTSRSPGFPYLPSNRCCMDRGEKCFKVNRFCGQFCPSSPSSQIRSGTKECSLSVNDESELNKCGQHNFQQLK